MEMMNGSSKEATSAARHHFVLVPLPAQGHLIPMADLARALAEHGALVSYITTPVNAARVRSLATFDDRVYIVELPFPCAEVGIPDGCENIDQLTSGSFAVPFFRATALLRGPMLDHLRSHPTFPTCIVTDVFMPWGVDAARELRIPGLVFHGHSCFTVLCYHNIRLSKLELTDAERPFLVPNIPGPPVEVTAMQAPGFMNPAHFPELFKQMTEAESTAAGTVFNTFEELEGPYMEKYEDVMGVKPWAIGPLPLAYRNAVNVDDKQFARWLDEKAPGSVIYVSFGSLTSIQPEQVIEIAAGLEASGKNFVLVLKQGELGEEVDRWMKEGFEERTKERGLVFRGWAPQRVIMAHRAVGGFMTHCGWNSVVEAVMAGVPMITWPHFSDQFLNAKFVVEVLGVGVDMGIKKPITFNSDKMVVIKRRDEVETAVRELFGATEEAETRRERARALGKKARKSVEAGGSSYQKLDLMMESFLPN